MPTSARILGHYRVTAKLGQGGMGEVYRATDTKLGREVAIKVLPTSVSQDERNLARFEREAKALAALNHPHIGAIYGFEANEKTHFIVLELVEGETLAERLRRGPLPLEEALLVGRQIAEAVEAAHAKGIIHRDLKPGNVKITPDGRVKVLDFGLAKATGQATPATPASSEPGAATLLAETTQPGAVLGTPAYMSPEQARGQEVDKRTDVWAFGCCLFECLAGTKPFRGDTVTDLMAEVLRSDPDWGSLPDDTPRELITLLRRCLEKDPRRRLRDLGDIALSLEDSTPSRPRGAWVAAQPAVKPPERLPTRSWFQTQPVLATLLALALLGLVIMGVVLWKGPKASLRDSQIRSLAVLPFAENTQDLKLAGLGKWIPAEIRSKLAPLDNLQVVNSPARIERLVAEKKSEVEIARELNVDGLVMGELHGQGETMSVYVWVVDGHTGRNLGKQREIASSTAKLSEIPNAVALAVVDELKLQVSTNQRAEIQVAETRNSEAFLAYQKGLDQLNRRQFEKAAVEFRRAYQLDTNYTKAWTGLASSEWVPLIYGGTTRELKAVFQRLSREEERFQARRPTDPALAALRMWIALIYERDWAKVRRLYADVSPSRTPETGGLQCMMYYYSFIEGHLQEASEAVARAMVLAPENLMYPISDGYRLFYFGRYAEAADAFRKIAPEKIQLEDYSRALLMTGDLVGAKEVAARVLEGRPNAFTQCGLAAIEAKSGAPDEARRLLQDLEAQAEKGLHVPYGTIAWSYGLLGDFEAARRWLHKGLIEGQGDWSMLELRTVPRLQLFGQYPWYWECVDAMKFPPLQTDHPYFALEQAMRYGRGGSGAAAVSSNQVSKTLAVLPFASIGGGAVDDDFNEGLTIELITLLQNVKGLQVQGPMASLRFKAATDPKQAGEKLGVDHLLLGKVGRAGERLRINVSLQKAADGFGLWAANYERKFSDIFAIQTEVAQQVAEALKLTLGVEENRALNRQPTGNAEAYSLYLQGRAAWNRRTLPDFERALTFFSQALEKDTNYALAYAGLADVHVLWPIYASRAGATGPIQGHHPDRAIEFATSALALDPTLAEPHAALGWARALYRWDWEGAEKEFRAAILLNPKSANAYHWYGDMLLCVGRHEEALRLAEIALRLDPSLINHNAYGFALICAGQLDTGIDYVRKRMELEPWFKPYEATLVRGLIRKGDTEKLAALFEKTEPPGVSRSPAWTRAAILAFQGRTAEAQALLLRQGAQKPPPSFWLVGTLYRLGEDDQALDVLEQVVDQHQFLDPWFLDNRIDWKRLHSHPRYQAVLRKLNLPN